MWTAAAAWRWAWCRYGDYHHWVTFGHGAAPAQRCSVCAVDVWGQKDMSEDKPVHVVLNEADFHTLISGGTVVKPGVRIILADMGHGVMVAHLSYATWKAAHP